MLEGSNSRYGASRFGGGGRQISHAITLSEIQVDKSRKVRRIIPTRPNVPFTEGENIMTKELQG
jgi:hypothetical protein